MNKILKNNVVALVFFAITLVIGITIGVVATNNVKKNMEFNVGVQYLAEFDIEVQIQIKKANNELEYVTIFKSKNPSTVNTTYVDSMTSDTINIKNTSLFIAEDGKVNLNFINNETEKEINVYVNQEKQLSIKPATTANNLSYAVGVTETPTTQLGRVLVSLSFEEKTLPEFLKVKKFTENAMSAVQKDADENYPYYITMGQNNVYWTSSYPEYTYNEEHETDPYNLRWIVLGATNLPLSNSILLDDVSTNNVSTAFGEGNYGTEVGSNTVLCTNLNENRLFTCEDGVIFVDGKTATQLFVISHTLLDDTCMMGNDDGLHNYFVASSHIKTNPTDVVEEYTIKVLTGNGCLANDYTLSTEDIEKYIVTTEIKRTAYNDASSLVLQKGAKFFLLGEDVYNSKVQANRMESFGISNYFGNDSNLATDNSARIGYLPDQYGKLGSITEMWALRGFTDQGGPEISGQTFVSYDGSVGVDDYGDCHALRPCFVLNLAV